MANLTVAKKAQPFEISLVNGYFLINFPSLAPQPIIQTCILYCFLLEGFDTNLHSKNVEISPINQSICECKNISKSVEYAIGRNIFGTNEIENCTNSITKTIKQGQHCRIIDLEFRGPSIVKAIEYNSETKRWKVEHVFEEDLIEIAEENLQGLKAYNQYDRNTHWRFEIKSLNGPNGGGIIFGLVENKQESFSKRLKIATSLASSSVKSGDYVDLYLDLNERTMMFIRNGWDFMGTIKLEPNDIGYRFAIQYIESFGEIEFMEYNESWWYIHQLNTHKFGNNININRVEAQCHAGIALTRPLFEFNHFIIGLQLFPNMQRWIDGLIFSVICGERENYELSYESAIRYQPSGFGGESVGYLAKIYYNQGIYDKALILLKLLSQTYVNKNKLNDAIAMCLAVMGKKKESVKYCDLHEQNNNNNNEVVNDINIKKQNMYMDQIAFCYEDVDDTKAIEYYKNAIENNNKINTLEWIYARMGSLYAKLKKFKLAKECYEKIINIKPSHYLSHFNYAEFLRNFEKYKQEEEDIKTETEEENEEQSSTYYSRALELALKSVGGEDDEDVVLTIIDCYRMLKDFKLAIKYLQIYLQNYQSDNIGIIMILKDCYIEIEDYENAISCLDKLFNFDENVFEYNFEYAELLRIYEKNNIKANKYYKKTIDIGQKLLLEKEKDEKEKEKQPTHIYEMLSICFENLEDDINAIKYYIVHLNNNNNMQKDILTMNKLANAYFRQKDYINSEIWFKKAIEIGQVTNDKLIYLIYYDYAMFLEDLKKINESKKYIRKSIEYCSKSTTDITECIHISSCYVQLKEYESVREWLKKAEININENEKNNSRESGGYMDEFNLNCALCYLLSDKDYENALKYLLKIDENTMKKCGLYAIASCIYRGFRDINNAFKCANIGIENSTEINGIMVHSAMAILLNETGKYVEADKHFNIALNIDKQKKDFELIESYSESLEHYLNNYEKSLKYAKILTNIACDESEICRSYIRIATINYQLNNLDESNKYFNLSLTYMNKITNNLEKEYIYQTFGYYYLITKQYALSYTYLLHSYKIDPREPGITGLLAICLYEMNKIKQSVNYLKKSINDIIDINDPFIGPKILLYYSNILFNNEKNYKECINLLVKYIHIIPKNNDEIYYLLSRCYSKISDFDNALKYVKIAFEINPNRNIYKNQIQLIQKIKVTDHEQYL